MRLSRQLAVLCGVCLAFFSASVRSEDTFSANYVMVGCRQWVGASGKDYIIQGTCAGIVRALVSVGSMISICKPTGATVGQSVRVVVQYIDARPARLNEKFEELAVEALQYAWPCKKQ